MGNDGGRRFSVGELHAASKTSSANGSHLNAWDYDISAAEFPQQKKRASLVWIDPTCGNVAANIKLLAGITSKKIQIKYNLH